MLNQRGEIKYFERFKQVFSFTGMERHRRITPTDIDGFIDYNGKAFVYIEGKESGKDIDYGQKLALEHLIKSHEDSGRPSIAILFTHDSGANDIVVVKDCPVIKSFRKKNGKFNWLPPEKWMNVLEVIELWEKHLILRGIII